MENRGQMSAVSSLSGVSLAPVSEPVPPVNRFGGPTNSPFIRRNVESAEEQSTQRHHPQLSFVSHAVTSRMEWCRAPLMNIPQRQACNKHKV